MDTREAFTGSAYGPGRIVCPHCCPDTRPIDAFIGLALGVGAGLACWVAVIWWALL